jgi:hypothetical protein
MKSRPLYMRISDNDLSAILPRQAEALQKLGCDRRFHPDSLCYWLDDRKPVFRCKSADRFMFLMPACPYAIMRQHPDKAPWEIVGVGQNKPGSED